MARDGRMTKGDFAALLHLTERQVDNLVAARTIKRRADGLFDLGSATQYIVYLKKGAGVHEARRQELIARTVDRRLKTKSTLSRIATDKELHDFVTQTWLTFIEAWRPCGQALYRAYMALELAPGVDQHLEARALSVGFQQEITTLIGEVRDKAQARLRRLLTGLVDAGRVDRLMEMFESEALGYEGDGDDDREEEGSEEGGEEDDSEEA